MKWNGDKMISDKSRLFNNFFFLVEYKKIKLEYFISRMANLFLDKLFPFLEVNLEVNISFVIMISYCLCDRLLIMI